MRKRTVLVGTMAAMAVLAGCTHTKATGFGARGGNSSPDEFAVTRAPPLAIPPDFALRPPKPGAPRPQEISPSAQALAAMFGGSAATSPGQQALVDSAGGIQDSGIRSSADSPGTDVVDKGATTQAILSAPNGSTPVGTASTPQPSGATPH